MASETHPDEVADARESTQTVTVGAQPELWRLSRESACFRRLLRLESSELEKVTRLRCSIHC